jgi:hypothetical protein
MGTRHNDALEQAANGGTIITGTGAVTGNFGRIVVIEDAVVAAITGSPEFTDIGDMATLALSANLDLPIRFTSITLTSGSILVCTDA